MYFLIKTHTKITRWFAQNYIYIIYTVYIYIILLKQQNEIKIKKIYLFIFSELWHSYDYEKKEKWEVLKPQKKLT